MRSTWKIPFFNPHLFTRLKNSKPNRKQVWVMKHRLFIIDKSMISRFFLIPSGRKRGVKLGIHPLMVGHRMGEFIRTKRKVHHYRKKRQKALEKRQKEERKKAKKTRVVDLARIAELKKKRKSRKLYF